MAVLEGLTGNEDWHSYRNRDNEDAETQQKARDDFASLEAEEDIHEALIAGSADGLGM